MSDKILCEIIYINLYIPLYFEKNNLKRMVCLI